MATNLFPKGIVFSEKSLFYKPVASFLVAISGSPAIFLPDNKMGYTPDTQIGLSGIMHAEMNISPHLIHKLSQTGFISTEDFKNSLCAMLTNHAYEIVKSQNNQGPVFEFFRHIRNAASHRNTFNFFPQEPRRPASWSGFSIDDTNKGSTNPLYGTPCFGTFLGISDLLLLLKDIDVMLNGP